VQNHGRYKQPCYHLKNRLKTAKLPAIQPGYHPATYLDWVTGHTQIQPKFGWLDVTQKILNWLGIQPAPSQLPSG